MLVSLRTYRLLTALLAVTLLGGASMPLVKHACAMALRHLTQHACCAEHGVPARHAGHEEVALPCHEADLPAPQPTENCCIMEAPQGVLTSLDAPKIVQKRLLALLPPLFNRPSKTHAPPSPAAFSSDTGPPTASVSLHLLHAVLLN